ncbi:MAG: hypothetical protein J6K01_07730 [Paludibacteraceae bacterium]|nr:hypothetical protein [Paludibacteraceae bacterium]
MKKIIYLLMSLSFVAFVSCSDDKENEQSGSGNVPENSSSVLSSSGKERGHSYVDLGLPSGTLWATCNVGAATPQDYGNYYAWGETTTKEINDWESYKYGAGTNWTEPQITKYCSYSKAGKDGFTDNKTILDPSDDAAYINWGGKWRVPNKAQQDELRNECYWVWTSDYNGSKVSGYIVYQARNSNHKGMKTYEDGTPFPSYTLADAHIFLPAAGGTDHDGVVCWVGTSGNYWANETDGSSWALDITFTDDGVTTIGGIRGAAQSVRAVIPGK